VKFYRKILVLSAAKKQFVIVNVVWRSVGNEIASVVSLHRNDKKIVAGSHLGFAKKSFKVRKRQNSLASNNKKTKFPSQSHFQKSKLT
jgi:hypothetical protein